MEPTDLYFSLVAQLDKCCSDFERQKMRTLIKLNNTINGYVGASRHKTSISEKDIEDVNKIINGFKQNITKITKQINYIEYSDKFEEDIRNYYEVKEITCSHDDKINVLWIQDREEHGIYSFATDNWAKYTQCDDCVKRTIESGLCSGEYMNSRLFKNGVPIKTDLESSPLKIDVLKFCYRDTDNYISFVLRKKDFRFYEKYFYKQLKQWYNKDNAKIIKAFACSPNIKNKFWNIKPIEKPIDVLITI